MVLFLTFLLLAFPYLIIVEAEGAEEQSTDWSYSGDNGPEHWKIKFPDCGSKDQSPITIDDKKAVQESIPDLDFTEYDKTRNGLILKNTGKTVEITLADGETDIPYVEHGNLAGRYKFLKAIFHFGNTNDEGSEHKVISNKSPDPLVAGMEIQLIHTYDGDAPEGTPTFLIITEVSDIDEHADHDGLNSVVPALKNIKYKDQSTEISANLHDLILSAVEGQTGYYYTYDGSLTFPPCTHIVRWILPLVQISSVSESQIAEFRKLFSTPEGGGDVPMAGNFRPLQDLDDRKIIKRKN